MSGKSLRLADGETKSSASRRFAGLALLAAVVTILTLALLDRGPLHALQCSMDGRDGWTIDLPSEPLQLAEFEKLVANQTGRCVGVVVASGPEEPTDVVIDPIGAKTWVDSSRRILVVTSTSESPGSS